MSSLEELGIGAASAKLFARHEAKVVVSDLTLEGVQSVADKITSEAGEAIAIAANVANHEK